MGALMAVMNERDTRVTHHLKVVHVIFRLEFADLLVDELRLADLRAFIPIALQKGLRGRCVSQEVSVRSTYFLRKLRADVPGLE
jgi:hypothetical protein